jgi:hypothetical protein
LIEHKPEVQFWADRTSINIIQKVLPLTPQQAMEGKVLDEDVEAVNKQIKDTFDGHSAVVRHVNFLVRETFEQYGWSIRKHEFEKHAYVFSAKEKK